MPGAASAAATATLVADRMVALDAYLKKLIALPGVGSCTQMLTFLGAYQGMQTSWFAQPNWARHSGMAEADESAPASPRSAGASGRPGSPDASGRPGSPAGSSGVGSPPQSPQFQSPFAAGMEPGEAAWELAAHHGAADGAAPSDERHAHQLLESLGLQPVLESYVANFEQLGFEARPDVAAAMTHRFLNGLEAAAAVDCNYRCSESVLWRT